MPERISTAHLEMTPGCYRIPDGHVVPNPPRPPRPAPAPVRPDRRLHRTVLACLAVIALVIVGRAVLIGVLG